MTPSSLLMDSEAESQASQSRAVESRVAMATWLPHMTSFCCCLGLESGAKLVGYMHLATSAALVAVCSWYAVQFGQRANVTGATTEDKTLYFTWQRLSTTAAAASLAHIALSALLLFGVYYRRPRMVRGWVVAAGALVAAAVAAVLVAAAIRGLADTGSDIFLAMLEGVLFFSLLLYCILGVNSYYMMLKSFEDMEGPKNGY